jgi:hypothetical protein
MAGHRPKIELLWWRGCPSWERALGELQGAVKELGLDPEAIEVREIDTEAAAGAEAFVGSPTIRIDGEDIQPPPSGEPHGLTCRIYHLRDGRISPLPDSADLRDALARAAGRQATSERSRA